VDVLDSRHCDFTLLKETIMESGGMRMLKESTRQDKYEPFRTQRLLARRATKNIDENTRKRLFDTF